jgi:hypothetical protein
MVSKKDLESKNRSLQTKIDELQTRADSYLLVETYTDQTRADMDKCLEELKSLNAQQASILARLGEMDEGEKEEEEEEDAARTVNHPAIIRSRGRVSSPNTIAEHAANEGYSITRAAMRIRAGKQLNDIEAEVDQELARNHAREGSFLMPYGDMSRLRNANKQYRADLTTSTGVGSVWTQWTGFIDYLYPRLIGPQLGFTYMSGLLAGTKLPRQISVPTFQAVAEQNAATASAPGLDNVTLTPHQVSANVTISSLYARQSMIDADAYVQRTLARTSATKLDYFALAGSGQSDEPTGALNNDDLTQYVIASGNAISYDDIVELQAKVAESNANYGSTKYVTSPRGFAKLQTTPKLGSTFPEFLVKDGMIDGEECIKSSQVPKNLTVSAQPNCTPLVYGNWEMLVVALFGNAVDIIVDNLSGSTKGDVTITSLFYCDTNLLQPSAFAICPNIEVSTS